MMKNWQTMLLALGLAVFTWFLVTGREKVEAWIDMPLVMTNPPEGMIIKDGLVDRIQVRVRGPRGLVNSLANERHSYPLDVNKVKIGEQVVEIDADRISLSSSFEVMEVKPNRLTLTVDRNVQRTIPVDASWAGNLNPYYDQVGVNVEPASVEIRGPETVLRKITRTSVVVKEDFPDEVPASWVEDVPLLLPEEVEASPGQVRVEVAFAARTKEIWIKLPLEIPETGRFAVRTSQDYVRFLMEGPLYLFRDNDFRKDMAARLVLPDNPGPGRYELDYHVTLPEGCRVVKRNPEVVSTEIRAAK
ncbi:CdaR family protein [Pseudodesulfovibrio tunisiensis]|uniref:CdaR family protein n=1 Tax=Pseudodesulfovibrio tunisiensis TaxID=463192 RepID=UPI001FB25EF7|nr:CdaR family protein [Pseudodesulfovibrio tunisiensis]